MSLKEKILIADDSEMNQMLLEEIPVSYTHLTLPTT